MTNRIMDVLSAVPDKAGHGTSGAANAQSSGFSALLHHEISLSLSKSDKKSKIERHEGESAKAHSPENDGVVAHEDPNASSAEAVIIAYAADALAKSAPKSNVIPSDSTSITHSTTEEHVSANKMAVPVKPGLPTTSAAVLPLPLQAQDVSIKSAVNSEIVRASSQAPVSSSQNTGNSELGRLPVQAQDASTRNAVSREIFQQSSFVKPSIQSGVAPRSVAEGSTTSDADARPAANEVKEDQLKGESAGDSDSGSSSVPTGNPLSASHSETLTIDLHQTKSPVAEAAAGLASRTIAPTTVTSAKSQSGTSMAADAAGMAAESDSEDDQKVVLPENHEDVSDDKLLKRVASAISSASARAAKITGSLSGKTGDRPVESVPLGKNPDSSRNTSNGVSEPEDGKESTNVQRAAFAVDKRDDKTSADQNGAQNDSPGSPQSSGTDDKPNANAAADQDASNVLSGSQQSSVAVEILSEKARTAGTGHMGTESAIADIGANVTRAPSISVQNSQGTTSQRFEKLPEFIDNLGQHVLFLSKGDTKQMTISLIPGELGRVMLKCEEKGNVISVSVHAENPAAFNLLQRQEEAVKAVLKQDGYSMVQFEVGTWSEAGHGRQRDGERGRLDEQAEDTGSGDSGNRKKPAVMNQTGDDFTAKDGRILAVA